MYIEFITAFLDGLVGTPETVEIPASGIAILSGEGEIRNLAKSGGAQIYTVRRV